MKLVNFIKENHDSIIDSWVKFARTMQPWAKDLSLRELQDHAGELIDALVEDMQSPHDESEFSHSLDKLSSIGQKHASGRLQTGISLVQLASEFRALRVSILDKWERAQGIETSDVTRFNEAIDKTLISSIFQYSEVITNTREQFLAILSHDLRNPIGAITMGGMLLKESGLTGTDDIITLIIESSERMARMVNDLLDLARTRLGSGIPVVPKLMDLGILCEKLVLELQTGHPKHKIDYKSTGDLRGEWDSDRISQVILNLATNALQYSPETSVVSVVVQEHGTNVALEVHNRGQPISEKAKKTIFEPMARQSGSGNPHGLGLGLYIASEIVKSHEGTIGVTSTEKEGTTFIVILPRRPAKAPK